MTMRYRQNPRCASRVFGGEAALITPGNQQISILDPVATEIWELCGISPQSIDDLCLAMSRSYEAGEDTIRTDVLELIEHLIRLGALDATEQ